MDQISNGESGFIVLINILANETRKVIQALKSSKAQGLDAKLLMQGSDSEWPC